MLAFAALALGFASVNPGTPALAECPMDPLPAHSVGRAALSALNKDAGLYTYYKSGPKLADEFGGVDGFHHGVASGSPTATSVIIWTRYTPVTASEVIDVKFTLAEGTDPAALLSPDAHYGVAKAEPGRDWTVKLDMSNLKPNTHYVYSFSAKGRCTIYQSWVYICV